MPGRAEGREKVELPKPCGFSLLSVCRRPVKAQDGQITCADLQHPASRKKDQPHNVVPDFLHCVLNIGEEKGTKSHSTLHFWLYILQKHFIQPAFWLYKINKSVLQKCQLNDFYCFQWASHGRHWICIDLHQLMSWHSVYSLQLL